MILIFNRSLKVSGYTFLQNFIKRFMILCLQKEKKLSHCAKNSTAVASAGSNCY